MYKHAPKIYNTIACEGVRISQVQNVSPGGLCPEVCAAHC